MQEDKVRALSAKDSELMTQIVNNAADVKRQIDEKHEPYDTFAALNELLDENGARIC